ncbi:mitochondrial potassium channel [Polypterus senegalus]|uniref:mitochondrial potassium channel n=1 Tax=Polypterus senegalus TaxID=55291 RepID=UPI001962326F|nr:mitochondrial potassium channel [Polypterus senegalus]XP_039627007.1 mitochondrial potassium channel [Polypterus senegalus]XP_039627008.1 mitochondrial potassium channel [Polypterus senegalus]XP_039627009.1 mitochondrial potassium channel [Polypterus senegalus]
MECRRTLVLLNCRSQFGPTLMSRLSRPGIITHLQIYCTQGPKEPVSSVAVTKSMHTLSELGKKWGRNSVRKISSIANYWWIKYEEFVGINEVRDAQAKVTEAEKQFMVARGIVGEAHDSLETHLLKLREIRDRLDRVSREESRYLELATEEHRLLQEERRLRSSYENAEEAEREKFALFSASVRESHEKERSRAERTKNWSIIGSVLGGIIGVLGSTYINRVRLKELKALLLEAEKGPINLQEAISEQIAIHHSQKEELDSLINVLRNTVDQGKGTEDQELKITKVSRGIGHSDSAFKEHLVVSKATQSLVEGIQPKILRVEQNLGKMMSELQSVKMAVQSRNIERSTLKMQDLAFLDVGDVLQGIAETEQRLSNQMQKNTLYGTVFTYAAIALTLPICYFLFKST